MALLEFLLSLPARIRHRVRLVGFALTMKPIAGAEDDPSGGGAGDDDPKKGGAGDDDPKKGGAGDDDPKKGGAGDDDPDWKHESRKHERRAKQQAKRAEGLEQRLAELEDAGKDKQDKALDKAREEATNAAKEEARTELLQSRFETAVIQHASDFADPDDALVHALRAVDEGELDLEEIFNDEGKVQAKALKSELAELLTRKPHLKATNARVSGTADGGRGEPAANDDMNALIRRRAGYES